MTKCEIDVPISSQDPVFLTKKRKFKHIMSQHSKIMMKNLSSGIWNNQEFLLQEFLWLIKNNLNNKWKFK